MGAPSSTCRSEHYWNTTANRTGDLRDANAAEVVPLEVITHTREDIVAAVIMLAGENADRRSAKLIAF